VSISAMKQALEVIEAAIESGDWQIDGACDPSMAIHSLHEAIAEAEKQEPLVWMNKYGHVASFKNDEYTAPLYTAPVHASDMSQERVDETAKSEHEWVGLDGDIPGLGLVTEEFYNGMLCAEDILRRRNT
jgi:hypothetical protein